MDRAEMYVVDSLELHLFFARIMKEHAFFLKVGFLPPNAELAEQAERLLRQFEALLSRAISLSDHVVRCHVRNSGELFTEFTEQAECQTQKFTGTPLDCRLTERVKQIRCWDRGKHANISQVLVCQVRRLNRDVLRHLGDLIQFKERLLCNVNSCNIFTVNYPLLIEHILREARLYRAHLMRLEGMSGSSREDLRDSELFWNQIMMEHAMFIRGLLDPSEDKLIETADGFANSYKQLLSASQAANDRVMSCNNALGLTQQFRDFKQAGVEGIENCKIKSIILPLLADHVLREANHYLRLLESKG